MADPKEPPEDEEIPADETPEDELEEEPPSEEDPPADDDETPANPEEEPADPEPEPISARSTSRGNRQFGELRQQLRETRQELADLKRQRAAPDPAAIADQQRRDREEEETVLASLDPGRIGKFYADRAERKLDQRLNSIAFHSADSADRMAFQTELQRHPELASVADEIEERLAQARAQGINPQRFALAKIIFAERILARSKPAATRQRRRADADTARQVSRPGSSRSDVATAGRRQGNNSHAARGQRIDESGLL